LYDDCRGEWGMLLHLQGMKKNQREGREECYGEKYKKRAKTSSKKYAKIGYKLNYGGLNK
jgi:hypothetical protein